MNDYEFAERITPAVAAAYREAKRSCTAFPKHTLIQTRALASLCCDVLGAQRIVFADEGLEARIAALARRHCINPAVEDLLHQLRCWGNRAAHPEDARLRDDELPALAVQALALARELLEITFQHRFGGAAIPAYDVAVETADQLEAACFLALVDGSAPHQLQVALHLMARMREREEAVAHALQTGKQLSRDDLDAGELRHRALDLLEYADGQEFAPACYQYGIALVEGARGADMVQMGLHRIAVACRLGDIDALAWCGEAALRGRSGYDVDHVLAFDYLKRAAAEDHPKALTLLAQMVMEGKGTTADPHKAFALTLRAAEAGYPAAQYQAAAALLLGRGVDQDQAGGMEWLHRASDAGQPEAQQLKARFMIAKGDSSSHSEAVELLMSASQWVNSALLDLVHLRVGQGGAMASLEALGALQQCYERALKEGDQALAQACRAEAPAIVRVAEQARRHMNEKELDSFLLTRFLFDEIGRPFPSRSERLRAFMELTRTFAEARGHDPAKAEKTLRKMICNLPPAREQRTPRRPVSLPPVQRRITGAKVGRNAPCPCSSGMKAKACCGV